MSNMVGIWFYYILVHCTFEESFVSLYDFWNLHSTQ